MASWGEDQQAETHIFGHIVQIDDSLEKWLVHFEEVREEKMNRWDKKNYRTVLEGATSYIVTSDKVRL